MEQQLIDLIKAATTKYAKKTISTNIFDEVSRQVLDIVSNFESENDVAVDGLTITRRDNGNIAVAWDEIIKPKEEPDVEHS